MRFENSGDKYCREWENIFAGNLKRLRMSRVGMTQTKLAGKLGANRKTYSQYERGIRKPPSWFVISTANYFSVTVDDLISGQISLQDKEESNKK